MGDSNFQETSWVYHFGQRQRILCNWSLHIQSKTKKARVQPQWEWFHGYVTTISLLPHSKGAPLDGGPNPSIPSWLSKQVPSKEQIIWKCVIASCQHVNTWLDLNKLLLLQRGIFQCRIMTFHIWKVSLLVLSDIICVLHIWKAIFICTTNHIAKRFRAPSTRQLWKGYISHSWWCNKYTFQLIYKHY